MFVCFSLLCVPECISLLLLPSLSSALSLQCPSLCLSILLSRHLHLLPLLLLFLSLRVFGTPSPFPPLHTHPLISLFLFAFCSFPPSSARSFFLSNFMRQGNNMLQRFQMETESVAPIRTAPDLISKHSGGVQTLTYMHTRGQMCLHTTGGIWERRRRKEKKKT